MTTYYEIPYTAHLDRLTEQLNPHVNTPSVRAILDLQDSKSMTFSAFTELLSVKNPNQDWKSTVLEECKAATLTTTQYLSALWYGLHFTDDSPSAADLIPFNSFIHKFEVFGRLFNAYAQYLRKANPTYDDPIVYELFLLCCLELYERDADLIYLNTALKTGDAICNFSQIDLSPEQLAYQWLTIHFLNQKTEALYDRSGFRHTSNK